MFLYFFVILALAVLDFGAVMPSAWLAAFICLFVGCAITTILRAIRGGPGTGIGIVGLVIVTVIGLFGRPPLALPVLVAVSCWVAAVHGTDRILRFFNLLVILGVLEALLGLFQFFVSPNWIFGYIGPNRSSGT